MGYDGATYDLPELAWTQRCFSCALVWLWDELLYDREARSVHAGPAARRGRARVRRLRRARALARLPGDRDRRAEPVRLLPRRPRHPRARRRHPGSRRARVRRLQPVGHRHAARAGVRRRGGRRDRAGARGRRGLPRHDEGGEPGADLRSRRDRSRGRVDRAARADRRSSSLVGAMVRRQRGAGRDPCALVRAAAHAPSHTPLEPGSLRRAPERLAERRRDARVGERLRRLGRLERA